jgi:hypothetical protein
MISSLFFFGEPPSGGLGLGDGLGLGADGGAGFGRRPKAESTRPERLPAVSVVIPTRRTLYWWQVPGGILQPEHDVMAVWVATTAAISKRIGQHRRRRESINHFQRDPVLNQEEAHGRNPRGQWKTVP